MTPEATAPAAPRHELYLYWRADAADAPTAVMAVRRWQQALRVDHPGLHARVLLRADAGDGPATLMEIYTQAGGVGPALQQRIVDDGATATAAWRRGTRHLEVFTDPG